jgi:signal transduction histidine kinase
MKRVQWVFWILALLAVNVYFAWPDRLPIGTLVIKEATFTIEGEPARQVVLPHAVLNPTQKSLSASYTMTLKRPLNNDEPLAIYVNSIEPRFYVELNGQRIYSLLQSENPHAVNNRRPHLIALPHPLNSKHVSLTFHHPLRSYEGTILGSVWIGSLTTLGPIYKKRYTVRVVTAQVMLAIYVLCAFGVLAYWYTDRRYNEPIWLSAACIAVAWVTYSGLVVVEPRVSPPLLLHSTIFAVMIAAVALAQFCFEQIGLRSRKQDLALRLIVLASALLALVLYEDKIPFRYALVMDTVAVLIGGYVLFRLIAHWHRHHDIQSQALIVGVGVTLFLGAFTVAASWVFIDTEIETYIVLFAPIPLLLTMGWLILRRYALAHLRTAALNRRLQKRVDKREREIRAAAEKVQALVREQTVRLERDRLMRDMHDGLGAQLITSMRMAERGQLSQDVMREALSQCLEEMHFAIESLKNTSNDLFVALADYRYRIEPRLEIAKVSLSWHMEATDRVSLSAPAVVQVLRIISEAIGNALKHSGSPRISVAGNLYEGCYTIAIKDDGSGFAQASEGGERLGKRRTNGLNNMKYRAETIGARFLITSGSGGTTAIVHLPLAK